MTGALSILYLLLSIFGATLCIVFIYVLFLKCAAFALELFRKKQESHEEACKLDPKTFFVGHKFITFTNPFKIQNNSQIGEINKIRYSGKTIYFYKWISENELLFTKQYQPKSYFHWGGLYLDVLYKTHVRFNDNKAYITGRLFPWGRCYHLLLIAFPPTISILALVFNFRLEQLMLSVGFGGFISLYCFYIALKEPKQTMTRAIQLIIDETENRYRNAQPESAPDRITAGFS